MDPIVGWAAGVTKIVRGADKLSGVIEGTVKVVRDTPEFKKPKSGSGKERANDIPSWAQGEKPYVGESVKDYAKRIPDEKYGSGNHPTGVGSEYNQLKKWGD